MRAVLLVALLLSTACSALAQEQRPGVSLEELGQSNRIAEFAPRYYALRGTDLLRGCVGAEPATWCQATVEAVMAVHDLAGAQQEDAPPLYCAPLYGPARWHQGLDALALWLPQQSPGDLDSVPAGIAVLTALRRAYPCPSRTAPRHTAMRSAEDPR